MIPEFNPCIVLILHSQREANFNSGNRNDEFENARISNLYFLSLQNGCEYPENSNLMMKI
jgi:hypothetical protein